MYAPSSCVALIFRFPIPWCSGKQKLPRRSHVNSFSRRVARWEDVYLQGARVARASWTCSFVECKLGTVKTCERRVEPTLYAVPLRIAPAPPSREGPPRHSLQDVNELRHAPRTQRSGFFRFRTLSVEPGISAPCRRLHTSTKACPAPAAFREPTCVQMHVSTGTANAKETAEQHSIMIKTGPTGHSLWATAHAFLALVGACSKFPGSPGSSAVRTARADRPR